MPSYLAKCLAFSGLESGERTKKDIWLFCQSLPRLWGQLEICTCSSVSGRPHSLAFCNNDCRHSEYVLWDPFLTWIWWNTLRIYSFLIAILPHWSVSDSGSLCTHLINVKPERSVENKRTTNPIKKMEKRFWSQTGRIGVSPFKFMGLFALNCKDYFVLLKGH